MTQSSRTIRIGFSATAVTTGIENIRRELRALATEGNTLSSGLGNIADGLGLNRTQTNNLNAFTANFMTLSTSMRSLQTSINNLSNRVSRGASTFQRGRATARSTTQATSDILSRSVQGIVADSILSQVTAAIAQGGAGPRTRIRQQIPTQVTTSPQAEVRPVRTGSGTTRADLQANFEQAQRDRQTAIQRGVQERINQGIFAGREAIERTRAGPGPLGDRGFFNAAVRGFGNIGSALRRVNSDLRQTNTLFTALTLISFSSLFRSVTEAERSIAQLRVSFASVGRAEDAEGSIARIRGLSDNLGRSFQTTARGLSSIINAVGERFTTGQTDAINQSILTLSAAQKQSEPGLQQFIQDIDAIISRGRLTGEVFRSLIFQSTIFVAALRNEFGDSLSEAIRAGEITSDRAIAVLARSAISQQANIAAVQNTVLNRLQRIQNAFTGFGTTIAGLGTNSPLFSFFNAISNNLELIQISFDIFTSNSPNLISAINSIANAFGNFIVVLTPLLLFVSTLRLLATAAGGIRSLLAIGGVAGVTATALSGFRSGNLPTLEQVREYADLRQAALDTGVPFNRADTLLEERSTARRLSPLQAGRETGRAFVQGDTSFQGQQVLRSLYEENTTILDQLDVFDTVSVRLQEFGERYESVFNRILQANRNFARNRNTDQLRQDIEDVSVAVARATTLVQVYGDRIRAIQLAGGDVPAALLQQLRGAETLSGFLQGDEQLLRFQLQEERRQNEFSNQAALGFLNNVGTTAQTRENNRTNTFFQSLQENATNSLTGGFAAAFENVRENGNYNTFFDDLSTSVQDAFTRGLVDALTEYGVQRLLEPFYGLVENLFLAIPGTPPDVTSSLTDSNRNRSLLDVGINVTTGDSPSASANVSGGVGGIDVVANNIIAYVNGQRIQASNNTGLGIGPLSYRPSGSTP